jgi:hypothetical protein
MLAVGGTVWAPMGSYGFRPGTIIGLGKNRGEHTVVHLSFQTGGSGQRYAGELWWRKPELKGKDKPRMEALSA